jgi:glycosyltransferase involved in cell wall biosynthesis
MPVISIIIPVYNVERYLRCCLDSVIAQSFSDFECILVDDGSVDNSPAICDEYVQKDNRFLVVHQKNTGVSAARNAGLDIARGGYIKFIDSDDWIESAALEKLYTKIIDDNAEIVICNFYIDTGKNTVIFRSISNFTKDPVSEIIKGKWGCVRQILVKKELVQRFRFEVAISHGEDYIFMTKLTLAARKISVIDIPLYHYNFSNTTSLIHSQQWTGLMQQYKATAIVTEYLIENDMLKKYRDALNYKKLTDKYRFVIYALKEFKTRNADANKRWIELDGLSRKLSCIIIILLTKMIPVKNN